MNVKVKRLHPDAVLPKNANPTDAGYDLVAVDDGVWSNPNDILASTYIEYHTGIAIEPPVGYHTEVWCRSSVSKFDLVLCNGCGLIDSGYTGEIILRFKPTPRQHGGQLTFYKKGDKIGQLVIRKTEQADFMWVDAISSTDRGDGGFGSSDKKYP